MLRSVVVEMGAVALDPMFFTRLAGATGARSGAPRTACSAVGPYGLLLAEDRNRIRLPAGFTSRVVARSLSSVPGTSYRWPPFPDGAATFTLVEVTGQSGSEITGPVFSPDGSRLYFGSPRGDDVGITYEVRGPFR